MDKQEFTGRVRAMGDKLYRVACGQLRDHNDRCDAVQEAVLKAWNSRGSLRNTQYFETWLIRILINECHSIQRLNRRTLPLEAAPETFTEPSFADTDLQGAILNLPEKLRMSVILYYIEGYDSKEIARILRVPASTVRTRLMRARQMLRDILGDDD